VPRIIATLCAIVCALAVAPAITAPAHADAVQPTRILIVGDSLTLSRHAMYSWRYRLDKEFHRQGVAFDFVGSLSSPHLDPGYPPSQYADPNFDQDHFCKAGWWLRDAIHGSLAAEVAKQHPDVVVLELGTADVVYGDSPAVTATRMRSAIAEIRTAAPSVRIILPQVLTRIRPDPTINVRTLDYDSLLPALAAEVSTAQSPVTVADTLTGWTPKMPYAMDGSHFTPTGEAFYAQRIAVELHNVGVLPQVPDAFHGYIPWRRTVPTTLKASAGRLDVSWTRQGVSSARVRWRKVGTSGWRTSGLYKAGRVTIPLPAGGAYEVQQQITWYLMTGPWGPTSRARVPRLPLPTRPARVVVTRTGVHWSASRRARSYVVQVRTAHTHRWITRRTTKLRVRVRHVALARVRAVAPSGSSPWRRGAA
jgi:GDSL-like Lipase/Acylhydrolase family